ncbi:1-aminocyclopropane-1-carboxylate oxidase-like [Heracleum sosnowskyi]|uniref:1-aminocyclopropane-1-carboxylate oxidase-like n=1 Tax=Heracleum sosnowskyi TaxID=360622 RepID=A0AAD8GXX1_9APIA|nr:1-aminocyclopropane-1-carboxylate oxidase-like [Heracleum sosnowskyi]
MIDEGHQAWCKEMEEFGETKAGIKGLVDSGVVNIPRIFVHPDQDKLPKHSSDNLQVPVIDLQGAEARRDEIVDQIRQACEAWGCFQLINHGMEASTIDATLEAIRKLHEQPNEVKAGLFSDDSSQQVRFYTTSGLVHQSRPGPWRDAMACAFLDDKLDSEKIPSICRKEMEDYVKSIIKIRENLSELLSEALGLSSDYLGRLECMKSEYMTWLYYPPCPEPHLTLGAPHHSDPTFLTIILQDSIGGLQFLHQNHWVDAAPIPGALIAHIGDLMQVITNDKFKSVEHRVLASSDEPRVSATCFLYASSQSIQKPFGPIKELISDTNPCIYKQVFPLEYANFYQTRALDGSSTLSHYKL